MAGSREKAWGEKKQFREGQAVQTLDDLVFVYCDTIIKLKPKIFILENVKGIIQGNAKLYSKKIVEKMTNAGYTVQVFCLNAASMGVPQKRERVFFIGHKKEFKLKKLELNFNEESIPFKNVESNDIGKEIKGEMLNLWKICKEGKSLSTVHPKGNYFGSYKVNPKETPNTVIASTSSPLLHYNKPNYVSKNEICQIGTFPLDYDFKNIEPKYLIGMSVPPVMIAQIANQIKLQWLDKIYEITH